MSFNILGMEEESLYILRQERIFYDIISLKNIGIKLGIRDLGCITMNFGNHLDYKL